MYELSVVLLGLVFGSFANVVIHRLPSGGSVVYPASRCPACGHPLGALDLVPVLSRLLLGGRCRYCGVNISLRYTVVEVLTAGVFLLVYLQWGMSVKSLSGFILGFILICSTAIDLEHGIIPDRLTLSGAVLGLALSFFTVGFRSALLGSLGLAGLLLLLAVLSRGGMGGGDIKLAAAIGSFCGLYDTVVALVLVAAFGGVYLLYLLAAGRAGLKTAVRYGPILSLGAFLGFNYGQALGPWYLSLFL